MAALSGLSVLLVEDEFLIALDAEQILKDLGARSVEIISNFAKACERAAGAAVDVVVLDVNLNGQLSFPSAEILKERGVPVVFASGYQLSERSPAGFEDSISVGKPYTLDALRQALLRALDDGNQSA
jgi:CheY-like chemotaxis protein